MRGARPERPRTRLSSPHTSNSSLWLCGPCLSPSWIPECQPSAHRRPVRSCRTRTSVLRVPFLNHVPSKRTLECNVIIPRLYQSHPPSHRHLQAHPILARPSLLHSPCASSPTYGVVPTCLSSLSVPAPDVTSLHDTPCWLLPFITSTYRAIADYRDVTCLLIQLRLFTMCRTGLCVLISWRRDDV